MSRGRPVKVNPTDFVNTTLEFANDIIMANGSIVKNSNVWTIIANRLGDRITPESLYAYVTNNRFNIRTLLLERTSVSVTKCEVICDATIDETSYEEEMSVHDQQPNETRTYILTISKETFDNLIVETSRGSKRNIRSRLILKPGVWEDFIADSVFEVARNSCGYNFKNSYISSSRKSGVFNGYCNCGGTLKGNFDAHLPDSPERVKISCTITKGDGNCGKRFLRKGRREKIVKEMGAKSAHVYRAEQANLRMEEGDQFEPPDLNTTGVLKTAKYLENKQQHLHENPILALQMMKHGMFPLIVRHIALDPFIAHYWSQFQVQMFRKYAARESSCLIIDATGSIMRKIIKHRPTKKYTGPIYLYHGVVRSQEAQFSVIQMISESHNANTIQHWLNEWTRSGAPHPKEVVTDGDRALQTAAVKAFTGCSTIEGYADVLKGMPMPPCYIRQDNAHFLKSYARFLSTSPPRVKVFYMAGLGQVIMARDEVAAARIIRQLFLVSLSETDGHLSQMDHDHIPVHTPCPTEAEKAKKDLEKLITGQSVIEYLDESLNTAKPSSDSEEQDDKCNPLSQEKKLQTQNLWYEWGKEIYDEVIPIVEKEVGDRVNGHFLPTFAKKLLNNCSTLPLWSCIVRDKFGYGRIPASSASVEGEFNKIKTHLLKECQLPMRADDFIEKHIDYLCGRSKILDIRLTSPPSPSTETKEVKPDEELRSKESHLNIPEPTIIIRKKMKETECQRVLKERNSVSLPRNEVQDESDVEQTCPACLINDLPSGNHSCVVCHAPIHNLERCSIPLGEEGYSQKRACMKCSNAGNIDVIMSLREKENWRGLVSKEAPSRSKRPARYLGQNILKIKEDIQMGEGPKKLIILKNGSYDTLRPFELHGLTVHVVMTCSFDSIYQVVLAALNDWDGFRSDMMNIHKEDKENTCNPIFSMALEVLSKGLKASSYKRRCEILYSMFPSRKQADGSEIVDCESSPGGLVLKLFKMFPSFRCLERCHICTWEKQSDLVLPAIAMKDIKNGIDVMTILLDNCPKKCRSKNCGGERSITVTSTGNLVIWEICVEDENQKIQLKDICQTFKSPLNSEIFHLVGIVNFTPAKKRTRQSTSPERREISHSTAICYRKNRWVEYDDTQQNEIYRRGNYAVLPLLYIYVNSKNS